MFVRHGLYAALRQPYATQYNGNTRADVLRAAQLASVLDPGSIVVPRNGGKTTFKLELLAAANGFAGHEAHDALADVRATAYLLRVIAAKAPATGALLSRLSNKNEVLELLHCSELVLVVEHFGTAVTRPIVPICPNPEYPAEWLGIDITFDPAPLLGLSPEDLATAFALQKRRLCRIRTNAMPLIVPAEHPGTGGLLAANVAPDVPARARLLRAEPGFRERLIRAAALDRREYPKATNVEDQLYNGFFPVRADEALILRFHAAGVSEKLAILEALQDERARQLGRRVIHNEWPEALSAEQRACMERERVARLNTPAGPWTCIATALTEIDQLLPKASPEQPKILEDYRRYLHGLPSRHAA